MSPNKQLLKSILTMGAVVEARDAYTGGHLWRVSQFSKLIALKIGLSIKEVIAVSLGGFLHDLGKIGVPDAILNKPDALTVSEYEIIKTHPVIGFNLIADHPMAYLARDVIRHHHERIDGNGYPDRLAGDGIALHARIVTIADAFDAMTGTRPYRKAMPIETALQILREHRSSQFDESLTDAFLELGREGQLAHIVMHSDEQLPLLSCPHCGPVIAVSRTTGDGEIVYCRICSTGMRLHRHGDHFEAEELGIQGGAIDLIPSADFGPIDDLVKQAPDLLLNDQASFGV